MIHDRNKKNSAQFVIITTKTDFILEPNNNKAKLVQTFHLAASFPRCILKGINTHLPFSMDHGV
jgi:hypothetical protein